MSNNHIYLYQTLDLTKTDIYKISDIAPSQNLSSKILLKIWCHNSKSLFPLIVDDFKTDFIERKKYGNHCFEGDYKQMVQRIWNQVNQELPLEKPKAVPIKNNQLVKLIRGKLASTFPNYEEDEIFGGNKMLYKIVLEDDKYYILVLDDRIGDTFSDGIFKKALKTSHDVKFEDFIEKNPLFIKQKLVDVPKISNLPTLDRLLLDGILELDVVYNYMDEELFKKVNKYKISIKLEYYDFFIHSHELEEPDSVFGDFKNISYIELLVDHLSSSIRVGNLLSGKIVTSTYCQLEDWEDFQMHKFTLYSNGFSKSSRKYFYFVKINNKHYDVKFFKHFAPSAVFWNQNGEFYQENILHQLIDDQEYSEDFTKTGEHIVFTNGSLPWKSREKWNKMVKTYKQLIKNNHLLKCLNDHSYTRAILTLLADK